MKVLVVDDSLMVRRTVLRILAKLGHETGEAVHGKDCLEKLAGGFVPDVVLLDWNMPELDGLDTLKAIKSSWEYPAVKVVMMTTENSQEKISTALAAGADEYIMKPFDEEIIAAKLAALDGDFL